VTATPFDTLRHRIASAEAVVAVVGLGYVGLPLLHTVAIAPAGTGWRPGERRGFPAIGLDHDARKIDRLRRAENYLPHLGEATARDLSTAAHVRLSGDPRDLRDADVIIICVPTPLDEHRAPDLSAVERAAREIHEHAVAPDPRRPRLIILESSTYPGTTRDVLAPIVRGDPSPPPPTAHPPLPLFFAYSPEREDPGNRTYTTPMIPKLVGGLDAQSGELARMLYERIVARAVPVSSAEVAEAAKLVENIYRAVNIALVNELKVALHAMGLDIWEVLDAAATKPFGFQRFNPGPGFGGHCVPIDPFYLSWKAEQAGASTAFIRLAGEVNRAMPTFVIARCREALGAERKQLAGSKVLVLGLAYKPNIADVRESPSFELIEGLREAGATVSYHDPYVPQTHPGRRHDLQMKSVPWSSDSLAAADLVLIATDHAWYDWEFIARHAKLVVDTRNAIPAGLAAGRVVKA